MHADNRNSLAAAVTAFVRENLAAVRDGGVMGRVRVSTRPRWAHVAVEVIAEQSWGDNLAQDQRRATDRLGRALRKAGFAVAMVESTIWVTAAPMQAAA